MSPSGYSRSPKVLRGALVQLIEDLSIIIPSIIPFQYNPASITRTVDPWNPVEVDQTQRGSQSPTVQPYTPNEKFNFKLDLHAADGMESGNILKQTTGVAAQIAAINKLTQPSEGLFGDLIASAGALVGGSAANIDRSSVPVILLIMGPGIIYPVRVSSISIEEKEFNPLLYPIHAEVTLSLTVLTPDTFNCSDKIADKAAISAYNFTKLQENALAILNTADAVSGGLGPLPI